MKRRTVLVGAGSAVAGSGAIVGSAAFSTSAAFGTVDVNVKSEDVEVYDSYTSSGSGTPANSVTLNPSDSSPDNNPRARRVNVDSDAFGLYAGSGKYEVDVTMVDTDGTPIHQKSSGSNNLDDHLTNIVDFRLLVTGKGSNARSPHYIEANADSIRNENSRASGSYVAQDASKRKYVPSIDSGDGNNDGATVESPGTISLDGTNGRAAQIAAIITLGDVSTSGNTFSFPDFRINVEDAKSY